WAKCRDRVVLVPRRELIDDNRQQRPEPVAIRINAQLILPCRSLDLKLPVGHCHTKTPCRDFLAARTPGKLPDQGYLDKTLASERGSQAAVSYGWSDFPYVLLRRKHAECYRRRSWPQYGCCNHKH